MARDSDYARELVDERLFRLLYGADGGAFTWIAVAFTFLGQGWVIVALLPLVASRRLRAPTLALVLVLLITAGVVAVVKRVVHRVRPCNALAGVGCLWGSAPTDFSFPSGHAAGSFAFAAFVGALVFHSTQQEIRNRAKAVLCSVAPLAATCIALSRVYLGVHFPADVAAGSCLGAAIGFAGARAYLRTESPRAADAPRPRGTPH
jgi:undecaprenyl-diphosphatase